VTFLSSSLSGPFFCLPETKDKTYEEFGILFARRVNTRKVANIGIMLTLRMNKSSRKTTEK
jgi:hypothetical protein